MIFSSTVRKFATKEPKPATTKDEGLFNPGGSVAVEAVELDPTDPGSPGWRAARSAGKPFEVHKQFFNRLEDILESDELEKPTQAVFFLAVRFLERRQRNLPVYPAAGTKAWKELERIKPSLRVVSGAFLEAIKAYEGGARQGKRPELSKALGCAFLLFACGELSLLDQATDFSRGQDHVREVGKACQPDSPLQFMFAELAGLCILLEVDTDFWQALLPALVLSQKLFHETYFDPTCAMPFEAGLEARFSPKVPIDIRRIETLLSNFNKRHTSRPQLDACWRASVRRSLRFGVFPSPKH